MGTWQYSSHNRSSRYWGMYWSFRGVRPSHPEFGQQWWTKRWIELLESVMPKSTNTRNRKNVRNGVVLEMYATYSTIFGLSENRGYYDEARQGILFPTLENEIWDGIFADIRRHPVVSELLSKNIFAPELDDIFRDAGEYLIPPGINAVKMDCTCWHTDLQNCRHLGPLWLLIADELEHNPLLLFELYGMMPAEALARLNTNPLLRVFSNHHIEAGTSYRQMIVNTMQIAETHFSFDDLADAIPDLYDTGDEDEDDTDLMLPEQLVPEIEPVHLPVDPQRFWHSRQTPIAMPLMPPIEPASVIKDLGPIPFWHGDVSIYEAVKDLYPAVSHRASALLEGRFPFSNDELERLNTTSLW